MSGITCPHCEGRITKGYTIKALAMLAKSEGQDLTEELDALAAEGFEEAGLVDEDMPVDGSGVDKGKRSGSDVGNKTASHRGKAPGAMHSSSRSGGKQSVDRTQKPTNPVTEGGGVKKSLNMPVIEGDAQLVRYVDNGDATIAKAIEGGNLHTPPARNLRAERELATGEPTPE